MRRSPTFLAGIVLTAFTGAATAQEAQPAIFINRPHGEQAPLVYSADGGWRWQVEERSKRARALEKPLTVFMDGPTGNTFVYSQQEGWKFVGRIADPRRPAAAD